MRIIDARMAMSSRREWAQTYTRTQTLRVWNGQRGTEASGAPAMAARDRLDLSEEARIAARAPRTQALASSLLPREEADLSAHDRVRIAILERMLGIQIRIVRPDSSAGQNAPEGAQTARTGRNEGTAGSSGAVREGWGVSYDEHETYQESERLTFDARGVIRTADGREIAFESHLTLSRSFTEERSLRIRAGDARFADPLVINYAGPAADLDSAPRFDFDLDLDGAPDAMPALGGGSGFLALDRNGDGTVTDGTELFGPASGDGFGELASLDSDGNGWLDEADPAWDRLRIWARDASGQMRLFALGAMGVGAIYAGGLKAEFTVKDAANRALAQNRQVGTFVRENGMAGTLQQIDIAT